MEESVFTLPSGPKLVSQLICLLLHTGCTSFYGYGDTLKVRWRKVLKSFHQLEDLSEEHFKSIAFNNSTNKCSKGTTTKKKKNLNIDYGAILKINI